MKTILMIAAITVLGSDVAASEPKLGFLVAGDTVLDKAKIDAAYDCQKSAEHQLAAEAEDTEKVVALTNSCLMQRKVPVCVMGGASAYSSGLPPGCTIRPTVESNAVEHHDQAASHMFVHRNPSSGELSQDDLVAAQTCKEEFMHLLETDQLGRSNALKQGIESESTDASEVIADAVQLCVSAKGRVGLHVQAVDTTLGSPLLR